MARRSLHRLAAPLLAADATPGERRTSAHGLVELFTELSGIGIAASCLPDHDTIVPAGTALSPESAARCVLDGERTSAFLRGIERAVRTCRRRFPDERIEVVYAGCGPWAALVIPACDRFTADQLRITLLDVHEASIESARRLITHLGLEAYFGELVACDATGYRHSRSTGPHIVVIEAMQRALEKEPQVVLTATLAPQLRRDGVLVPERVAVDACLADLGGEFQLLPSDAGPDDRAPAPTRRRIELGRLLELTAATAPGLVAGCRRGTRTSADSLPPIVVTVPPINGARLDTVMLRTEITVLGDIVLGEYASGLTMPCFLHQLGRVHGGETIEFRYRLGERPGFRCRLIPS